MRRNGRSLVAALAVTLGLAEVGASGQEPSARLPDARLDELAQQRVLLLVEPVRVTPKHFSGMAGSTYWLRVREVLRFEREPGVDQDPEWRHEFEALAAHSRDLAAHHTLEWCWLYAEDDAASTQRDRAVQARLARGAVFVLATATTADFSTMGTIELDGVAIPNRWGQLRSEAVLLEEATAETVAALRARLGDLPRRAAPRRPAPTPPRPGADEGRSGD